MSKVNCEAVGKRRQASLRMARAELLLILRKFLIQFNQLMSTTTNYACTLTKTAAPCAGSKISILPSLT